MCRREPRRARLGPLARTWLQLVAAAARGREPHRRPPLPAHQQAATSWHAAAGCSREAGAQRALELFTAPSRPHGVACPSAACKTQILNRAASPLTTSSACLGRARACTYGCALSTTSTDRCVHSPWGPFCGIRRKPPACTPLRARPTCLPSPFLLARAGAHPVPLCRDIGASVRGSGGAHPLNFRTGCTQAPSLLQGAGGNPALRGSISVTARGAHGPRMQWPL